MSTIMGLGDLLGAYLGGSYSTPQATVAGDGSTGQSTSYLPSGTASDVAGAIGNGLYPQETQQSPFAYYSPPAANTNYQMTGSPQQGGLTAPGILTPGVLGGGGVGTGTVLGANTNTVPAGGFNYGGYGGGGRFRPASAERPARRPPSSFRRCRCRRTSSIRAAWRSLRRTSSTSRS